MASDPLKLEEKPPVPTAEEAPDPDEDDLSDLDDVLDQFTSTKIDSKLGPSSSGPGRPPNTAVPPSASAGPTPATAGVIPDDDEFSRQLQAGMQDLLGELDSNPEMATKFEELMKELQDAAQSAVDTESATPATGGTEGPKAKEGSSSSKETRASTSAPAAKAAPATSGTATGGAEASFQDTIRKTMERMKNSSESASAAAASSSQDDFLTQLLKEMESNPNAFPSDMGSDEDFSKMLMGMMEQLTNKEILYEPMKELNDKFPVWLEENRGKTGAEDLRRYEEQSILVKEIVGKFEEKGYSDEKVECREYIVERMQKMQAAGSPPPDLVGDMNAAQEALGELDAGCSTQ